MTGNYTDTFNLGAWGTLRFLQWGHASELRKTFTAQTVDGYARFIPPGGVALDIGAYTGDTAVPMALAAGPTGLCLAFEPNPASFAILDANAALLREDRLGNLQPLPYAISDTPGWKVFHYTDVQLCNGGAYATCGNHVPRFVETRLLEQWTRHLPVLHFLKVDAEGYDSHILAANADLFAPGGLRPVTQFEVYPGLPEADRLRLARVFADNWCLCDPALTAPYTLDEFLALDPAQAHDVLALPAERLRTVEDDPA